MEQPGSSSRFISEKVVGSNPAATINNLLLHTSIDAGKYDSMYDNYINKAPRALIFI